MTEDSYKNITLGRFRTALSLHDTIHYLNFTAKTEDQKQIAKIMTARLERVIEELMELGISEWKILQESTKR